MLGLRAFFDVADAQYHRRRISCPRGVISKSSFLEPSNTWPCKWRPTRREFACVRIALGCSREASYLLTWTACPFGFRNRIKDLAGVERKL
jgi:hypothetical protein